MSGSDDETDNVQNQNNINFQQLTLTNSNAKFPYLKNAEEYDLWSMKMQNWITNIDWKLWEIVKKGNSLKRHVTDADGIVIVVDPKTVEEVWLFRGKPKSELYSFKPFQMITWVTFTSWMMQKTSGWL